MSDLPTNIHDHLMQLPKEEVIDIMSDALDQMQIWNGRSITFCVVTSIPSATYRDREEGGIEYRLPKIIKSGEQT